jgi:hypothetical protein
MSNLYPEYPTFLEDHSFYVGENEAYSDGLKDAFKLIDDPKCKRVATSLIKVFRLDLIRNLKYAVDGGNKILEKYNKRRSTEHADNIRDIIGELVQYGITTLTEGTEVVEVREEIGRAELIWVGFVFFIATDESKHPDWTLTTTFPVELLNAAYGVLSKPPEEGQTVNNLFRELIGRCIMFTIQKFCYYRMQDLEYDQSVLPQNFICGHSPSVVQDIKVASIAQLEECNKPVYYLDALKEIVDNNILQDDDEAKKPADDSARDPKVSPDGTPVFLRHSKEQSTTTPPSVIYAIQETENEFIVKLTELNEKFMGAKALWDTVFKRDDVSLVAKEPLKPTIEAFVEAFKYYEAHKTHLGNVKNPFQSSSLVATDVLKWDANEVVQTGYQLVLLYNVLTQFNGGVQEFAYAIENNGKRSMSTAARNMQEMIAGSECCPGRKLAQGLKSLEEMAFVCTPAPYYGVHDKITKHKALQKFGKAAVVIAVIAIHNIDKVEVIDNNNIPLDKDGADDSVVLQKNNQTTIVFCPTHPYTSNANQQEKATELKMLYDQFNNIKQTFNDYINSDNLTLKHETKEIMCTSDINEAVTFFTGKQSDLKIMDTIKRSQSKKRKSSH